MDVQYIATDSILEMLASMAKVYFIAVGMQFYIVRLKSYNQTCADFDPLMVNDAIFLAVYVLGIPVYLYRMTFAIINATIWFPKGAVIEELKIYNIVQIFDIEPDSEPNYDEHLISYLL